MKQKEQQCERLEEEVKTLKEKCQQLQKNEGLQRVLDETKVRGYLFAVLFLVLFPFLFRFLFFYFSSSFSFSCFRPFVFFFLLLFL